MDDTLKLVLESIAEEALKNALDNPMSSSIIVTDSGIGVCCEYRNYVHNRILTKGIGSGMRASLIYPYLVSEGKSNGKHVVYVDEKLERLRKN